MKRLKTIYTLLLLAVALPLLTACSSDDATGENNPRKDGKVTVRLRLSQAAPATTRADWKDENATADEMMNVWTVVIVKDNKVVGVQTCEPTGNDREIDDLAIIELETGTYTFYSFANIGASYIEQWFGLPAGTITPSSGSTPKVLETLVAVPSGIDATTVTVNGNLFNAFSGNENGFGSYGIPMSNKQTKTIGSSTTTVDLIVVRMLAKIELWLYNDKDTDLNIKSITLTDITGNASDNGGTANLKLFPKYTNQDNANTMEVLYHGDIRPNLTDAATKDPLEITPSSPGVTVTPAEATTSDPSNLQTTSWTIPKDSYKEGYGTSVKISFYVNESATPTHDFKHFFLELEIEDDENATLIGDKKQRYTLIGGVGETYTEDNPDEWNYIARNDYRIIPIVLDDYKLDMIPYDFPAIGVYPASMKEEDGIYTITFHDYGHFHLQPKVTKYSANNPKEVVPFTATTPTGTSYATTSWGLVNNNFASSWGSWTDATKTTEYKNEEPSTYPDTFKGIPFYRRRDSSNLLSFQTKDGDDAGGEPVWYKNDGTDGPQWASDWAPSADNTTIGYQPFIFGYIADPGEKPADDKKVYHEFSINLYKKGTGAARQMTYRLYMILDQNQMMYPGTEDAPTGSSRALGAPSARHTHGH